MYIVSFNTYQRAVQFYGSPGSTEWWMLGRSLAPSPARIKVWMKRKAGKEEHPHVTHLNFAANCAKWLRVLRQHSHLPWGRCLVYKLSTCSCFAKVQHRLNKVLCLCKATQGNSLPGQWVWFQKSSRRELRAKNILWNGSALMGAKVPFSRPFFMNKEEKPGNQPAAQWNASFSAWQRHQWGCPEVTA